jgi:para-nitrobenzyl esterase
LRLDVPNGIVGDEPDRHPLQQEMAGAWFAFARTGNSKHSGMTQWLPFTPDARSTMVFDRHSHVVDDPLREERLALEAFPRYIPAIGEEQA